MIFMCTDVSAERRTWNGSDGRLLLLVRFAAFGPARFRVEGGRGQEARRVGGCDARRLAVIDDGLVITKPASAAVSENCQGASSTTASSETLPCRGHRQLPVFHAFSAD
jgi:hypothetical protein